MKKTLLVLAVLFATVSTGLTAQTASTKKVYASASAANQEILTLARNGLKDDDLLLAKVAMLDKSKFDVSAEGIVELKNAGVSSKVITAMLSAGAAPASVTPAKPGPSTPKVEPVGSIPSGVLADDGVYYVGEGAILQRIESKTPSKSNSGNMGITGMTWGMKKSKVYSVLRGLRAEAEFANGKPSFYLHLANGENASEYSLVKFTQTNGHRELQVGEHGLLKGTTGAPEEDVFQVDAKRLQKDIYLITSKQTLSSGEYGLVLSSQPVNDGGVSAVLPKKVFDFSVR